MRRASQEHHLPTVQTVLDAHCIVSAIPLKSVDIEAANTEAAAHWQAWLDDVHTENAEGYWIGGMDDRIHHFHVAIEYEDRISE
jgi:hypothetical protein